MSELFERDVFAFSLSTGISIVAYRDGTSAWFEGGDFRMLTAAERQQWLDAIRKRWREPEEK